MGLGITALTPLPMAMAANTSVNSAIKKGTDRVFISLPAALRVGEYRSRKRHEQGILYAADGTVQKGGIRKDTKFQYALKVKIHHKSKFIATTMIMFDTRNNLALLKEDFRASTVLSLRAKGPEMLEDVYVAGYQVDL